MKQLLPILLFFLSMVLSLSTKGQTDTISLESVIVEAVPIRQDNLGGNSQKWTLEALQQSGAQNVGDLLNQSAGVFIKSYGLGSLATSSIRGGSAGHTQVLWNGLPIHSPMLGLLDLSLLPVTLIDQASLSRGGNSALWGSGSIGGVLNLQNQTRLDQGLSILAKTEFGSFGHFQQSLKVDIGKGPWSSSTKLFLLEADNDFPYRVDPSLPTTNLEHARWEQRGFQQTFKLLLPKQQSISAHAWIQFNAKQIPPTITQNRSESFQEDRATRLMLDYENYHKSGKTQAKVGYAKEHIDFFDDIQQLAALSFFTNWTGEVSHKQMLGKHTFLVGSTQIHTQAESDGYRDGRNEYRGALFGSWRWEEKRWALQTNLRQAWVEDELIPFVPSIATEIRVTNWLTTKAKFGRNYRLPTLNDRFWQPGGNPDILPEQGWSTEGTLQFQWQHQQLGWQYSFTSFNRHIDDFIRWTPQPGTFFWSASNISKVWSRGLEQRLNINYLTKNLDIYLNAGYDYIRSTNEVALEVPRLPKGSQLIYIPEHQGNLELKVRWKQWSWSYQHQWTGTYAGTNGQLAAFQTANTRIQSQLINGKQFSGTLFAQIYNLWDGEYFVIERRPMPGRYFRVGVQIGVLGED